MKRLLMIPVVLLAAFVFYGVINGWVLEKRLTHGLIGDALVKKRAYAALHKPPRVFLLGGSNIFYSFSCATIAKTLGETCVNYGTSFDVGLAYALEIVERDIQPGDTVVMGFEYYTYLAPMETLRRGLSHPIRMTHDKSTLTQIGAEVTARTIFRFDARYVAEASVETVLAAMGLRRRIAEVNVTAAGDLQGMSADKARAFQPILAAEVFDIHRDLGTFRVHPPARVLLTEAVARLRNKGVHVVATLPTLAEGYGAKSDVFAAIEAFFAGLDVPMAVLANHHVYPQSCFFDTHYHLNESCQIVHSEKFADTLKQVMETHGMGPRS